MKTILVTNQKGGTGKTTVADELAFALERRGASVCFQNLDPQGGVVHVPSLPNDDDDYMVVDTPPMLHTDFQKWCKAADIIIMPTRASMLDLVPLQRCYELARKSKTKARIGIVVNFFDSRRLADADFIKFLCNASMPVWGTIPTATAIIQAQGLRVSVFEHNKSGRASKAFEALVEKVIEEVENE
jgi:chromosome partitioning protein